MVGNGIFLLIFVGLVVFFGWITQRAWRLKNRLLKWFICLSAGLVTLLCLAFTLATFRGYLKIYLPRNLPIPDVQVAGTPEQVARGEHLAASLCAGCHTSTLELPLSGGKNLSEDSGLPLGDLYPPNLTAAGELANWSDGEILRAIREGADKDNRVLLMPVQHLHYLSDEDAEAIIAYLRTQPAVANEVPETTPSPLLLFFLGTGLFNADYTPVNSPVTAPPKAATAEYGEYIINYNDCRDCHGQDLTGGKPPYPPGPNLRQIKGWTPEQFITALRTGVTPSGHALQPPMLWQVYGKLDDVELTAVYTYLKSLPPITNP